MSDTDDSGDPRDEAQPEDAQIDQVEGSDAADEEFHPFDELDEDFKPGPAVRVIGTDGMPVTLDQTATSDIPALSTKTLVCMGDYSSFVLRNRFGIIVCSFSPGDVERMPNGKWTVPTAVALEKAKLAIERERARIEKLQVTGASTIIGPAKDISDFQMLANALARNDSVVLIDPEHVTVEPVRPPCKHYVRQAASLYLNPEHRMFARLCSARRTTEGTFMTVRDTGVWACDMRDPYDAESVAEIDKFDALKIEQGRNREFLPMVNALGIFSPQGQQSDPSWTPAPGTASVIDPTQAPKEN